jgi:GAF domain-containing protein
VATPSLHPDAPKQVGPEVLLAADDAAIALQAALEGGKPDVALPLLNRRTHHRFTAVHRFEPRAVWCVLEFDRESGTVVFASRLLAPAESYSVIVQQSERPFYTEAAEYDARLMSHPARSSVRSYLGVPLRDAFGRVIGALCHYDPRARPIPRAEIETLQRVTPLAERWLRH